MNFYRISIDEGKKRKYAFGILISDYLEKLIRCNSCGREWKRELISEKETELTICLSNSNFADFTNVVIFQTLISEKAKDVFNKRQITGFTLNNSLNIISKKQISDDKMKKLRIYGGVQYISDNPILYYRLFVDIGAKLHQNSEIILSEKCDVCGFKDYITLGKTYVDPFHPLYLIEDSWNGNDLFMVKELWGAIFCTQRFVDIYKEEKLSGLLFDKIEAL